MDKGQLHDLVIQMGQGGYRGGQISHWLHQGVQIDQMTNLPKGFRHQLEENYTAFPARIIKAVPSKMGETVKYLFAMGDDHVVEGVLMGYHHGNTLCVSTQIGCRMGCRFCASTQNGCVRNLTAGEMLAQVVLVAALHKGEGRGVTNLVLMGSGEPMENYENCVEFIRMAADPERMGISPRNVSLSTCGIVEGIDRLAGEGLPLTLSLSLHAPNDEIRRQIMPVANRYDMNETLASCARFVKATGRRMIIEYTLIQGINDSLDHAKELSRRLQGLLCHVNLIPLNPIAERDWTPPSPGQIQNFLGVLQKEGISATRRREMGDDIEGACGQLRRRHIQESGDGVSNKKELE